jgi:hypothetical protein
VGYTENPRWDYGSLAYLVPASGGLAAVLRDRSFHASLQWAVVWNFRNAF